MLGNRAGDDGPDPVWFVGSQAGTGGADSSQAGKSERGRDPSPQAGAGGIVPDNAASPAGISGCS